MSLLRRRALAAATAVAALAGGAGTVAAPPEPAHAQEPGCQQFKVPKRFDLRQNNGFVVTVAFGNPGPRWYAAARPAKERYNAFSSTSMTFTSFKPELVKFTINWSNGGSGVYTGTIDANGFVEGTTVDRYKRTNRAHWRMTTAAICARYA
ncbi:MAG TPA: hypothetical protein VD931_10785 [Baekduia sp.]|nr:hypothetical protein [Baekduia sp.]